MFCVSFVGMSVSKRLSSGMATNNTSGFPYYEYDVTFPDDSFVPVSTTEWQSDELYCAFFFRTLFFCANTNLLFFSHARFDGPTPPKKKKNKNKQRRSHLWGRQLCAHHPRLCRAQLSPQCQLYQGTYVISWQRIRGVLLSDILCTATRSWGCSTRTPCSSAQFSFGACRTPTFFLVGSCFFFCFLFCHNTGSPT